MGVDASLSASQACRPCAGSAMGRFHSLGSRQSVGYWLAPACVGTLGSSMWKASARAQAVKCGEHRPAYGNGEQASLRQALRQAASSTRGVRLLRKRVTSRAGAGAAPGLSQYFPDFVSVVELWFLAYRKIDRTRPGTRGLSH